MGAQLSVHATAAPALPVQRPFVTSSMVSADRFFSAAEMQSRCANQPLSFCRSHRRLSRIPVHPCSYRRKYSSTTTLRVLPQHGTFHLERSGPCLQLTCCTPYPMVLRGSRQHSEMGTHLTGASGPRESRKIVALAPCVGAKPAMHAWGPARFICNVCVNRPAEDMCMSVHQEPQK